MSTLTLDRTQKLFDKQWVAQAQLDDAKAQHDRNVAAVAEAERRIAAAKLPNRSDPIDAAAASVEAGRHSLEQAEKNLDKRQVFAPAGGTIEEVYFRPGEVVNAGQAVVALLPPGNLKVRFFVQEAVRADSSIDQTISVACDGCKGELTAKISFIARDAEFTPPVIFSREQRQKLVYLVEARPAGATAKLTAGQPVTVSLGLPPRVNEGDRRRRRGADQVLRRPHCGQGPDPESAQGGDLRLPRAERQRQDHHHPHAVRAAHARLRPGHLPWLRYPHPVRRDQARCGLHDPALQSVF